MEVTAQGQLSGQPVIQFTKPVTISIAYDETEVHGHEASLKLYYYDESLPGWVPLHSEVDTENNILKGYTNHFSLFDWQAQNWEAARLPTVDGFQVSTQTGAATYSYPIWMPPGPGGLQPSLTLSYNSQTVDGSSSRGQASWVGMGWSLDTGYIRRNMNGTPNDYEDDTFSLVAAGVGGQLIEIDDGNPNDDEDSYRLADDNFWRITHYRAEGEPWTSSYDWDISYWLVEDKQGNKYYFGDDGGGTWEGNAWFPAYTGGCSAPFMQTWQWSLVKQENIFGKALTYSYTTEIDDKWHPGCHSYQANAMIAMYPDQITYPHGNYRVRFDLQAGREDYVTSWKNNDETVLFEQSRLDEIYIEHKGAGATSFEHVKRYKFTYTDGTIFPNIIWPAADLTNGKTPTLTKIEEFGPSGSSALPATEFTYDDNMHITLGENGYGGEVGFNYDSVPFYELGSYEGEDCSPYWDPPAGGGYVDDVGVCTNFQIYRDYFQPGGTYKISADVQAGRTATIGINYDGTNIIYAPAQTAPSSPPAPAYTFLDFYITIPAHAHQARVIADVNGDIREIFQSPVTTKYRTASKTSDDPTYGTDATFTYTYDEPATNDAVHSNYVNDCNPDNIYDHLTAKACAEFRGHAMVQELGPVGTDGKQRLTTTWFHQDDEKKGKPAGSLVGEYLFTESFNDTTKTWSYYDANGWDDSGGGVSVTRKDGDQAVQLASPGNWQIVWRTGTGSQLGDGEAVLFQFYVDGDNTTNATYAFERGSGGSYRRWGVVAGSTCDGTSDNYCLAAQYTNNGSTYYHPVLLDENSFKFDNWYMVLMVIDHDDGFFTFVWDRNDPTVGAAYTCATPCTKGSYEYSDWIFKSWTDDGTSYLDGYTELSPLAMSKSFYLVELGSDTNSPIPEPVEIGDFEDLEVVWTALDNQVSYTFDGDAAFVSTLTQYKYEEAEQDNNQYGNVTHVTEMEWTGTGWDRYRSTLTEYYPDASPDYLVGFPGYTNQYKCPGNNCDYQAADLLSSHWYLYDGQDDYFDPPIAGKLTRERDLLDTEGTDTYSDRVYTYDSWGNRDTVTTYSTAGGVSTLSTGPQTITTTFDITYTTYPIRIQNDLSQVTVIDYDYALGVPVREINANGAMTTATYDEYGRLKTIRKPGDTSGVASGDITYNDTGNPFNVVLVAKIDSSNTSTSRKFYNGLGQLIQTQLALAELEDNACSTDVDTNPDSCRIIVDYEYDRYGNLKWQSVPYAEATGTTYFSPSWDDYTETKYDVLGRTWKQIATDGATTEYVYDDLDSITINPLSKHITSTLDVWGRTVKVEPPDGPYATYTYDELDQLLDVYQNTTKVSSLTYDEAGRKTDMWDADMGTWAYTYDAIGNLKTQTDARDCDIIFTYDELFRLTEKDYDNAASCDNTPTTTYAYDGDMFRDPFSGTTLSSTDWSSTGSVTVSGGAVHITGNGSNWDTNIRRDATVGDGYVGRVFFKASSTSALANFFFSFGTYGSGGYRRWGINLNGGNIRRQYYSGVASDTQTLMSLKANTWYEAVLVLDSTDKFRVMVWEYGNPSVFAEDEVSLSTWTDLDWKFLAQMYSATLDIAEYQESPLGSIGQRSAMDDASGDTVWQFDLRGRVIQETKTIDDGSAGAITGTFVTQWGYNLGDMVTSMTYPGGTDGTTGETVDFGYLPQGLLDSVDGTTSYLDATEYDAASRLRLQTFGSDTVGTRYIYYAWDTATQGHGGRLHNIKSGANPDSPNHIFFAYDYDATGNITEIRDWKDQLPTGTPQKQIFEYDDIGRLTSAKAENGTYGTYSEEDYQYDTLGRISLKDGVGTYTYGDSAHLHAVTTVGSGTAYTYDDNGNMITRDTGEDEFDYTYDGDNRLVQVGGGNDASYVYDGDGNLVQREDGDITTFFVGNYFEVEFYTGGPTPTPTSTNTPGPTATPDCGAQECTPTPTPTNTSTPTNTPTPTPTPGDDLIFEDGFEDGTFNAWSDEIDDNSELNVTTAAAMIGEDGMQADIDDTDALYAEDDSPVDEDRYRMRFYFDPNSISMSNGKRFTVFGGIEGTSTYIIEIEFGYSSSSYYIRAHSLPDTGSKQSTSNYTISDAEHYIEIDWLASSGPGADNGYLKLWIDGTLKETLSNLDNDTREIDLARLGAVKTVPTGLSGSLYFDAFESRRENYIGPETGGRVSPTQSLLGSLFLSIEQWLLDLFHAFFGSEQANEMDNQAADLPGENERSDISPEFLADKSDNPAIGTLSDPGSGETWRSYYYAGSARIAMRVQYDTNDDVFFVLSDHLGSTAKIVDSNGDKDDEARYKAWGEERYPQGTHLIEYQYTGQRNDSSADLYFYNARWYDPVLGRFTQADAMVPGGSPQAWDRYAYSFNNPINYNDPSGHVPCIDSNELGDCIRDLEWKKRQTIPDNRHGPPLDPPLKGRELTEYEIYLLTIAIYAESSNSMWSDQAAMEMIGWVFLNRMLLWERELVHTMHVTDQCMGCADVATDAQLQDEDWVADFMDLAFNGDYSELWEKAQELAIEVASEWKASGTGSSADPTNGSTFFFVKKPEDWEDITDYYVYVERWDKEGVFRWAKSDMFIFDGRNFMLFTRTGLPEGYK